MNFSALKSKKLWVTAIGGLLVTVGTAIGIPHGVTEEIVALVAAFVIGQGFADFGKEKAKVERLG